MDLVYDWDNVQSYEHLVLEKKMDDDILVIVDDVLDSIDPVEFSYKWPSYGGTGYTKGERLLFDAYVGVRNIDERINVMESRINRYVDTYGLPLPSSKGGGIGNWDSMQKWIERAEELDPEKQWSVDPRRR